MGQLGELLKEARQNKGGSLEEIEEELRIRKKYLQALEEEDFSIMPPEVYIKGFLRNYAIYLGLDPEEVRTLYYKERPVERGRKPDFLVRPGQMAREETGPRAFPMDMSLTQSRLLAFPFLVAALAILAFSLLGLWAFREYFPLPGETGTETRETVATREPRPTSQIPHRRKQQQDNRRNPRQDKGNNRGLGKLVRGGVPNIPLDIHQHRI